MNETTYYESKDLFWQYSRLNFLFDAGCPRFELVQGYYKALMVGIKK